MVGSRMASFKRCYVLLFIALYVMQCYCSKEDHEPFCTSRYDFESKLLEKMLRVDLEMTLLKERTREDLENIKTKTNSALAEIGMLSTQLKSEQASKVNELTSLGNSLKEDIDKKKQELDKMKTLQGDDFASLHKEFEIKSEERRQDLKEQAVKPTVVFFAKNVHTTILTTNTVLRYTDTVFNADNVYDPSTGFFTAPLNGSYLFAVQICPYDKTYLVINMFADDRMISATVLYNADGGYPCSTINAVAILSQGSRVCVKTGSSYASEYRIQQDNYRWVTFMGTIIQ